MSKRTAYATDQKQLTGPKKCCSARGFAIGRLALCAAFGLALSAWASREFAPTVFTGGALDASSTGTTHASNAANTEQASGPSSASGASSSSGARSSKQTTPQPPRAMFVDVTREAGIGFIHQNGAGGEKLLPETMGGGCAFLDYDNDGHQDLLFVNARLWPWDDASAHGPTMALYRNDGNGRFQDVTSGSGLDVCLYGMGVAVGDFDNDGRVDVFLSAVGANRLFRNQGDGTFADVTDFAGVAGDDRQWSTSCGWLDYDNDGDLDLFVCNYVKWSREYDAAQNFRLKDGARAYGRPQNFEGAFPYLYRNDGNGRFTEVSEAAGLYVRHPRTGASMSKSLGVTFHDIDQDGWMDVIVANDTVQNQLFHNLGNGAFKEIGAMAGVAFDDKGNARGAMGIDAAHFRNSDELGIAIGNFAQEMTALYVSHGRQLLFTDESVKAGLGRNTQLELTFGVFYFDYDLDGRVDLLAVNGHLEEDINRVVPGQFYQQPPQLFWNGGPGGRHEFLPVTADRCGEDLLRPMVGRGAAFADIDGDGDLDVLITAIGRAPRLLRNDQKLGHDWLRIKLVGKTSNRDAVGAEVSVHLSDRVLRQQVMPTRSYLSQTELPLTFGLGSQDKVQRIAIRWPDGSRQEVENLQKNQLHVIEQAIDPNSIEATDEARATENARGASSPHLPLERGRQGVALISLSLSEE